MYLLSLSLSIILRLQTCHFNPSSHEATYSPKPHLHFQNVYVSMSVYGMCFVQNTLPIVRHGVMPVEIVSIPEFPNLFSFIHCYTTLVAS